MTRWTRRVPWVVAFAVVADLQGSPDVFRWTIGDADAGRTFDLDARALGGSPFTLTLAGDGGRPLATVGLGPDQRAHLYDLRLEAGTYQVTLAPASSEPRPYVLSAAFTSDPNADPEPNDIAELAAPLAVGTTVHGRLASVGDTDSLPAGGRSGAGRHAARHRARLASGPRSRGVRAQRFG